MHSTASLTTAICGMLAAAPYLAALRSQDAATRSPSFPEARISNGVITAKLYLPDAQRGFYRSTRFDWSGMIRSLEFNGHQYYGPWFTASDPTVRDFVYRGADIAVSSQSGAVGPAEEFQRPQGYDTAKPGETFVKIGVGVLKKADVAEYSAYKTYEIVDAGKWTVRPQSDSVEFSQEISDTRSGYGTSTGRSCD